MAATFVRANILERDPAAGGGEELRGLDGQVDVMIACQFLHLFDWEGQVAVAKRVVGFSRPGSLLVGYQRAQMEAGDMTGACGRMYFHNVKTFREMWDRVENETGRSGISMDVWSTCRNGGWRKRMLNGCRRGKKV